MKLVFIYGLPATGKYTVAKELAAITGYKLFHNHLVVDMLLAVFEFGSEPFVALREEIWLSVFEEAAAAQLSGLIFTFNPESTVGSGFVSSVMDVLGQNGGVVEFVQLQCPLPVLRDRMDSLSRRQHRKLTSVPLFDRLYADGAFDTAQMPQPRITIDTGVSTAADTALEIAQALQLPRMDAQMAPQT